MPTAVNPATGERLELVNGQWVPVGSAAPAPAAAPAFNGYIPGNPKPKEPKAPVFVPQGATQMFNPNTNTYEPVPKGPATGDEEKEALKNAISGLGVDELLQSVGRARDNLRSGWATGTWGAIAELKPGGGTPRDDFLGNLGSIQGGVILEKLQALKEASKTGASGMGALSEKEGERLASSVAALTPNMSPGEYEKSFKQIALHAKTLAAIRDGKDPRDPAVAKQIEQEADALARLQVAPTAAPTGGGGGGSGGDPPPGISEMTPEQQARDKAFLATNPTPQQYSAFMSSLLNRPIDEEAITERLNAAKKGAGYSGAVDERRSVAARIESENRRGAKESPVTTLVKQGAMLNLSDEAAGVGNALAGVITGVGGGFGANYRLGRDVERQRIADARQQLGYAGTGLEIVGGFASANPSAALAAFSPRAAVGASALGGFVGGYGSGEGTTDSLVRGAGGAAIGAAVQGGANRIASRLSGGGNMAPELAQAAEAEGVNLNRAMVDPRARGRYGELESNRFSQPVIRDAAERTREQMAGRAEALGGSGTPLDTEAAGGVVQGAGRRFIQRSRGVADRLYNRARSLAGDARFEPTNALAQVDNEIAQLSSNPETNAGEIAFLEGLRRDLATPGGKSVEELRQLRTSLRGRISEQGLTATQAEARAIRAMDATQQDVAAAAPAAASAYRRADTYYRERMTHIDDIIKRITGGNVGGGEFEVSGEKAFARLKAMASPGGDGRRLAALMRDLDGNERQDIAATIAQSLGRDAPDEPFSAAKFLQQTRRLSPSARRTIFGPDGAQSIENLRTLSLALKESGQDINRSRSGTLLERTGWRRAAYGLISGLTGIGGYTGGVAGGLTGAAVGGAAMGASVVAKRLSARAMVNPRVSRWLAQAANVGTRTQAVAATRRLGTIISREPALANELRPIYDMLQGRVAQPLAAEPAADDGNNE